MDIPIYARRWKKVTLDRPDIGDQNSMILLSRWKMAQLRDFHCVLLVGIRSTAPRVAEARVKLGLNPTARQPWLRQRKEKFSFCQMISRVS